MCLHDKIVNNRAELLKFLYFLSSIKRTRPGSWRLRRLKPQISHRWFSERNTSEGFPVNMFSESHVVIIFQFPDNRTIDSVDYDSVSGQIVLDVKSWTSLAFLMSI